MASLSAPTRLLRGSLSLTNASIGLLLIFSLTLIGCSTSQLNPILNKKPTPDKFAVASAHPMATDAGISILQQGGNAFDAAVAIAASLAVVEPYGSGLGGGGFWLIYEAESERYVMIDAREKAPLAAHENLFIENGEVNRQLAVNSALSAGIPGQIAAFEHISKHYGTLPLATTLAPAISHAADGFPATALYQRMIGYRQSVLAKDADSAPIFLQNGEPPDIGSLIKQPHLQKTLEVIAKEGADAFYKGSIATEMLSAVQSKGGIWTAKDLADYQVVERMPIISHYKGNKIISASPPSSGGVALASMFNMLQPFEVAEMPDPTQTHLLVESMRRAYFDRAHYLGDPDFFDVPLIKLTSREHAAKMIRNFSPSQATPSKALGPLIENTPKGENTTHFSVLDQNGNIASVTLSINLPFGSGITAGNTGILLNNEMDDFSSKPGSPNAYKLVGNHANKIEPGKRPLSSMSPTIIEMPHGMAVLGTPGGSRIISMVFLASLKAMQGRPPEEWVALPRFHHQYLPDHIQHEPGAFSEQTMQLLKDRGHQFKDVKRTYGNMHAILWNRRNGQVDAASDPRGIGIAKVGKLEAEKDGK